MLLFESFVELLPLSREEADSILGREQVVQLIANGKLVYNPFRNQLERARGTDDFFP